MARRGVNYAQRLRGMLMRPRAVCGVRHVQKPGPGHEEYARSPKLTRRNSVCRITRVNTCRDDTIVHSSATLTASAFGPLASEGRYRRTNDP